MHAAWILFVLLPNYLIVYFFPLECRGKDDAFQLFDYGKPCYSSPAFELAISRFEKQKERKMRRVLNKCMQSLILSGWMP